MCRNSGAVGGVPSEPGTFSDTGGQRRPLFRRSIVRLFGAFIFVALATYLGGASTARAYHGGPHTGTLKVWDLSVDPEFGCCPAETEADPTGLTDQVSTPGAPLALVTVGNLLSFADGFPGLLYWNPATNVFKSYGTFFSIAGGLDINRSLPGSGPPPFGGGDVWFVISDPIGHRDVWVHLPGGDHFRAWDTGQELGCAHSGGSGIRINPITDRVYLSNFLEVVDCGTNKPGRLIELDPATDTLRSWPTESAPRNFVLAGPFVYATAAGRGSQPDQILRLNPATNELKRWNVPGGGFSTLCCTTPFDDIETDAQGNIWFTETSSGQVGRLRAGPDGVIGTSDDVIDEYAKPTISGPAQLTTLGAGAPLQAVLADSGGHTVDVLTAAVASPTSATVAPSTETPTPTVTTATHTDHTIPVDREETIAPTTVAVTSSDPSGIDQFPFPPAPTGTMFPTGLSEVLPGGAVFGSAANSTVFDVGGELFQFTSGVLGGVPATLTLNPKTATNPVDSQHCVTATVEGAAGTTLPGVTVRFAVSGAVTATGSGTTDSAGTATFCYQGPALPGADTIHAYADSNENGVEDVGEPSDNATKTWVFPTGAHCAAQVTNGGSIVTANGDTASFGGNVRAGRSGEISGNENYQDHGPTSPMHVRSLEIVGDVCSPDETRAAIFGTGEIDGAGSYDLRIDVQDLGEPGRETDTYRLRLSSGYDSGEQRLRGGNVQIH